MPVDYQVPSWIRGPSNLAQDFLSGLQAGANIAHQRQALAQQSQLANLHAQVQQQQMMMDSERQRQQLEMQKAYHDQITQIRQQQLADQQQKISMATQLAASKFAAQQTYQSRVARGEDPAKVMLELGPSMGASAGDISAAMKDLKETDPKEYGDIQTQDLGGGYKAVYRTGSPGLHLMNPPRTHDMSLSALAALASKVPDLERAAKIQGPDSLSAKLLKQIEPAIRNAQTGATHRYNPDTKKIEPVSPPSPDQDQAPAPSGIGIPEEPDDAEY